MLFRAISTNRIDERTFMNMCAILQKTLGRENGDCHVMPLCRYEVGFNVQYLPNGLMQDAKKDGTIRIESADNSLRNKMFFCDTTKMYRGGKDEWMFSKKEVIPANCNLIVTGPDKNWTDGEVIHIKKLFSYHDCMPI